MSPNLAQCVVLLWIRLIQADLRPIFGCPLSTLLYPVLASSFPLWQDFSKRANFPIVCAKWFYKKAVWGLVKSWEYPGNLRCSKILRIRRKNPLKWVLSISRDYWVYLDNTLQSFEIWEFWGEFWGIETFYRSKFSPATGVTPFFCSFLPGFLRKMWFLELLAISYFCFSSIFLVFFADLGNQFICIYSARMWAQESGWDTWRARRIQMD